MLKDWQAFQGLAKRFAEGEDCLRVAGLSGSARALTVAELLQSQAMRDLLSEQRGVEGVHRLPDLVQHVVRDVDHVVDRAAADRREPLDYAGVQAAVRGWQPFAGLVYFHLLLANLAEHGTLPEP